MTSPWGLVRGLYLRWRMPPNIEANDDVAALGKFVRFPVTPSAARWRGRGHASSGRIGILWYNVSALVRFDDWPAISRAVERLPIYKGGTGLQGWHEFLPPDILPSVEGPAVRRGPYHAARTFWNHDVWKGSDIAWICAIGDGPYMLASLSSESVDF